jgi:hypothetical protein
MSNSVDILKETAARLYELRASATTPEHSQPQISGFTPIENDCHTNVTNFCTLARGYTPISGWLLYDLTELSRLRFIAHSVVRDDSTGKLIDITPGGQGGRLFLEHPDHDEFYMLVTGHDLEYLEHHY